MIKVYVYGCTGCGVVGKNVRRVQAYGLKNNHQVEVVNTKYNLEARETHLKWLKKAGIQARAYTPIVVNLGKNELTELSTWNS